MAEGDTTGKRLSGVELHLVESWDDVQDFLRWLSEDRGREWLAVDLETSGLEWYRERIRLAQFGDTRDGWAIPFDRWGGLVGEVFGRVPATSVRYVAHNKKFDRSFLIANGFIVPDMDDTMDMAYLREPNRAKGLKPAATRHVDERAWMAGKALDDAMKKAKWTWGTIPWNFPLYWQYAALDTVLTANLAMELWPYIEAFHLDAYMLQVESNNVLLDMEMRGMRIDRKYCEQTKVMLDERQAYLQRWFIENHSVDPLNNLGLVKWFWEQGIEVPLETEKGQPSVKKESLELIDHPLVEYILEARKCQKMSGTYFGNLLEFADNHDILHPQINPLGAVTGRQSITRPALQTLPRNQLVRDAFIPRRKHKLLLADFQGQEMRIFAEFSQDPEMLAAYDRGEDLHNFLAAYIYGADFTKQQRQVIKNAGFSKIYGAGIPKFSVTAGIPVEEGERVIRMYDEKFVRARPFQAEVVQRIIHRAHEADSDDGYIITLNGRRVPVPKKKAYVGVNYIIQGSCADILRATLVDLDHAGLVDFGEDGGLVLPVHDETAFDLNEKIVDEVTPEIVLIMEHSAERFGVKVPMVVETGVFDRWGTKYAKAA